MLTYKYAQKALTLHTVVFFLKNRNPRSFDSKAGPTFPRSKQQHHVPSSPATYEISGRERSRRGSLPPGQWLDDNQEPSRTWREKRDRPRVNKHSPWFLGKATDKTPFPASHRTLQGTSSDVNPKRCRADTRSRDGTHRRTCVLH